jgi:hypothetical protein
MTLCDFSDVLPAIVLPTPPNPLDPVEVAAFIADVLGVVIPPVSILILPTPCLLDEFE